MINSTTPVITPPSEWVLVTSVPNGTAERTYVYRKLAGGSEPASYQFGFSFTVKWRDVRCTTRTRIDQVSKWRLPAEELAPRRFRPTRSFHPSAVGRGVNRQRAGRVSLSTTAA